MKELSIEEKAKAYDEAYKKVAVRFGSNVADEIFSQFEMSEDERIRKDITAFFKNFAEHGTWKAIPDVTKWIAWLEKQAEQKVSVVEFKAKDWYVSKVDGKIYNAKFMENPTNQARRLEIEKAAMSATGIIEQEEWFIKGAEWSDKNPFCISSEKQGEQKPAWSKEDKNVLEDIEEAIINYWHGDTQDILLNWLKSLKDRVQPQPKPKRMRLC